MRRYLRFLCTIYFYFYCGIAFGQVQIDSSSIDYYNGVTHEYEIIDTYVITNKSKEEYLTWIALDSHTNKSDVFQIRKYFFKPKNDFSFLNMMNELSEIKCQIGYTFIKNILPGESFAYIVTRKLRQPNIYINRIVVIERTKVEDFIKTRINENLFFNYPLIVLSNTISAP